MIWFVFGGMGLVFLPLIIMFLICGAHWELRGASKSRTGNET